MTRRELLRGAALLPLAGLGLAACSDDPLGAPDGAVDGDPLGECRFNDLFLADGGVGRDGIPSLTNPDMATPGSASLEYLSASDRVVAVTVDGQAYAVPHRILWWHEIVNLDLDALRIAITLCPLTGSSLVFDRAARNGEELGVSGLLYKANLIMFNRGTPESLWPQMMGEAQCGTLSGESLEILPAVEMEWGAWKGLHPDTLAVSADTGFGRDYSRYPYGDYEELENESFLGFPVPDLDPRRPPKERVIGLFTEPGVGGLAFPYGSLRSSVGRRTVEFDWAGAPAVLLWSDEAQGGMPVRPRTSGGTEVTLSAGEDGFTDQETGSRWTVDGRAVAGTLAGETLVPVSRAYTAFWGSWAAFFPDTELRE